MGLHTSRPTSTNPSDAVAAARAAKQTRIARDAEDAALRQKINWDTYFQMTRRRRMAESAGTVLTGLGAFSVTSIYLTSIAEFDPTRLVMGMDPTMVVGLQVLGATALGAMVGSQLGGFLWRVRQGRALCNALDAKDRDFFRRIRKYRPHHIKTNLQHPMPDYYGEKIRSRDDYKGWLKKQREYQKKMLAIQRVRVK